MEKISSILPSTARIKSVDLKDGQAVRPGGPSFGRTIGSSPISKVAQQSTAQIALGKHEELMDRRTKDQKHAEMVKNISDGFFMKRINTPKEAMISIEDPIEQSFDMVNEYDLNSESDYIMDPASGEFIESSLVPPGSFVDLRA